MAGPGTPVREQLVQPSHPVSQMRSPVLTRPKLCPQLRGQRLERSPIVSCVVYPRVPCPDLRSLLWASGKMREGQRSLERTSERRSSQA